MIANTRFPHRIVVTRDTEKANTYPPEFITVTVVESVCRSFPSKSGGTGIDAGAFVSDYTVSMPRSEVRINTGDNVTVTDAVRTYKGSVVSSFVGNLGTNIWFNEIK